MRKFYLGVLTYGLSLSAYAVGSSGLSNEVGIASYYGDEFEGCPTANGEKFAQSQLTCAHLSLPLGTWVKVTNLRNHKWVILRVNDRGPYIDGRMVDLSRRAAEVLGFTQEGLAQVKLEVLKPVGAKSFGGDLLIEKGRFYGSSRPLSNKDKAVVWKTPSLIHRAAAIPVSGKLKLPQTIGDNCRFQTRNKESYLVFFGIFYRLEKVSAFHEETNPVISEIEPLRFFQEHRSTAWISP